MAKVHTSRGGEKTLVALECIRNWLVFMVEKGNMK